MPRITFIHPDAREDSFEVDAGTTVMRVAIANDIDGILGECGGAAMCATCHVYIEPEFIDLLMPIEPVENEMLDTAASPAPVQQPPIEPVENEMLDTAASPRQSNSRLGCQVLISKELDGLRVRLPPTQT